MDFDKTFKALSASAKALATKLADFADKGAPSFELEAPATPGRIVLRVFAGKADVDPDGIFGAPGKDSTRPIPVLHPTPGRAWIKYEFRADVTAKAARAVRAAKFAASARAGGGMGAYLPAPSSATLAQAIHHEGGIPLVLDAGDMRQLAPDHVAYATVAGTLSAKLEFNWADVLAGPIAPLQGLVPGDKPVNLAVDFKAGLSATISINDSFRLVFAGVDEHYVSVSLNRASSDAFSVKAGATATVRLEKPDLARGLLANLAAQLLDVESGRIDALREQLETVLFLSDKAVERLRSEIDGVADQLDTAIDAQGLPLLLTRLQQLQAVARWTPGANPATSAMVLGLGQAAKAAAILDQLAENIAEKIGGELDEVLKVLQLPGLAKDAINAARGLLQRLEKIEAALLRMARKRIESGLDFEYRRVASDASVLKARLRRSHPDFAAWHRSLLALDAASVLEATQPANTDAVLDLFLHQKSIRRSVSLGMDLGWFYSDRHSAQTQWTESTRMVGSNGAPPTAERRLALMGSRSREETALGTPSKCRGQFDAGFLASGSVGVPGRWSFALSLAYASGMRKADRRWLHALADYACVWGVIRESELDWLVGTLEDDGAIGGKVDMEISFTIDHAAFAEPSFLAAFGTVSDFELSRALACALQRMEQFPERATPTSRAATYSDAVAVLLGRSAIDVTSADQIARFVSRHLVGASRDLKDFESRSKRPIPAGSVAYLTQHTGSWLGVIRHFKEAGSLHQLAGVPTQGGEAERELVSDAFRGLDLAWRDRFLLRWQVALLRSLATRTGVSHATSSTLKVTIANRKVRIIAPRATEHLLA